MSKAVRFDDYGGVEVLEVRDVARPEPGPDQVLVAVRAAGINPSEGKIRTGAVREIFPATFPSGQGRTSPASSRRSARASVAWPSATR
jgi:NADPH:quinone reductase